jgi:adenosine kinase
VQNISAPFICQVPPFKAALSAAIQKADFLFGNETEAAAFAESEKWDTKDVKEIAAKISKMDGLKKDLTVVRAHVGAPHPRRAPSRPAAYGFAGSLWICNARLQLRYASLKLVYCRSTMLCAAQVITQGKEPTIVAKAGSTTEYKVPPVDASEIVDTNGAGDAFVGGFLAAFIKGKDVAGCCEAGNFAAATIIRSSGTALPSECSHQL